VDGSVTIFTNGGTPTVSLPIKLDPPKCNPLPVTGIKPSSLTNLDVNVTGPACCHGFISDTLAASPTNQPRIAQFNVNLSSCGDYKLLAKYGSEVPRGMKILVDGQEMRSDGLSNVQGSWQITVEDPNSPDLVLPLKAGPHTITLERQGSNASSSAFPTFEQLDLFPWK
jgi:hypothetical protein